MKKVLATTLSFMFLGFVGCASTGNKIAKEDQVKVMVIETVPKGYKGTVIP